MSKRNDASLGKWCPRTLCCKRFCPGGTQKVCKPKTLYLRRRLEGSESILSGTALHCSGISPPSDLRSHTLYSRNPTLSRSAWENGTHMPKAHHRLCSGKAWMLTELVQGVGGANVPATCQAKADESGTFETPLSSLSSVLHQENLPSLGPKSPTNPSRGRKARLLPPVASSAFQNRLARLKRAARLSSGVLRMPRSQAVRPLGMVSGNSPIPVRTRAFQETVLSRMVIVLRERCGIVWESLERSQHSTAAKPPPGKQDCRERGAGGWQPDAVSAGSAMPAVGGCRCEYKDTRGRYTPC